MSIFFMCGIIGFFHEEDAFSKMQKGLLLLQERGRDGCGYYDGKNLAFAKHAQSLASSHSSHIIGHNLHAIVHTVAQPLFSGNVAFIANCEIYNWKILAEKYNIHAKNDSDLLFHLLKKIGLKKTLPLLRGVYAFAYWDKDTIFLARDILGVKPLWYHYDGKKLSFSSEKKHLVKLKNLIQGKS